MATPNRETTGLLWRSATACALFLLSTGGAQAQELAGKVEKCGKKLGSLAVVEPQFLIERLYRVNLGSPSQLLRLMIQESGCFDVVERGAAMQNLAQERALASGGQLRGGSNVGDGQMQAADFVLTPSVQFVENNTGGVGGAMLNRFGLLGAVLGGLKFKEAETSIVVSDVRSSIQVASAQGQASKVDFSVGGWAWMGGGAAAAGGYTRTPEGRVIAASLLDNYNKIVAAVRDKPLLIATHSASSNANARASTQAAAPIPSGQMLSPRLAGVRVFAEARADSKVLGTLQPGDQVIATGEAEGPFIKIESAQLTGGWVQKNLVAAGRDSVAAPPASVPLASSAPPPPPGATAILMMRPGNFAGTFSGEDSGSFRFQINDGQIDGTIDARDAGVMYVTGQIDRDGNVSFQGDNRTSSYLMRGRMDPGNSRIAGNWRSVGGAPRSGSFVAERGR